MREIELRGGTVRAREWPGRPVRAWLEPLLHDAGIRRGVLKVLAGSDPREIGAFVRDEVST